MLVLFVYLLSFFLLSLFFLCIFFLLEAGGGWCALIKISEKANKDSGNLHMRREYSYFSSNESCLLKKNNLECYLTECWIKIITKHCGCSQKTVIPNLSHQESFQVAPVDGYFPPELHNKKRGLNWLCPSILAFQQYKVLKRLGNDNKSERVQHVLPSFVWHMKSNISHQEKNRHSKQLLNNKGSMWNLVWLFLLPSTDILERFESRDSKWFQVWEDTWQSKAITACISCLKPMTLFYK